MLHIQACHDEYSRPMLHMLGYRTPVEPLAYVRLSGFLIHMASAGSLTMYVT